MNLNSINRILLGIKRNPKKLLISFSAFLGVLWTFIEISSFFFKIQGTGALFLVFVLVALIFSLFSIMPPKRKEIKLKNYNNKIVIQFGDLFTQKGNFVISLNDFFDYELGNIVSEKSLHGYLIKEIIGSEKLFKELIDKELKKIDIPFSEITERKPRRKLQYPIGTTVFIKHKDIGYFLPALTHTDVQTHKVNADLPELWTTLNQLWKTVKNHSNGKSVNLPLVGTGLAGVGLSYTQVLEIIIISIYRYPHKITDEIRIILHEKFYEEIDLNNLNW